jgi:branched-chain amino acid transport system substrate-binding protein
LTRLIPYLILLALLLPNKAFSQQQTQSSTINIGLLVPDTSTTISEILMAERAVMEANNSGGYQNQKFKLVVRTTKGPWGTGSKESVALVFDDEVVAIVGSLDGRNAHLAEQVAAKSHLTYIECFATEPTLSQAYVPWFMRVVPNDDQQAEAIVELIVESGGGKTGILSVENYDTRYAVGSLSKAVTSETGSAPLVIHADSPGIHQQNIIEEIRSSKIKHLIVPFDAEMNKELLVSLKELMPSLHTYGTLHFTTGAVSRNTWKLYEGMYLVSAGPIWIDKDYNFVRDRGAFAIDGVVLLIKAIQEVGTDREDIQKYLFETKIHEGFTGPISFDELGNRTSKPVVARIEQGKRVIRQKY